MAAPLLLPIIAGSLAAGGSAALSNIPNMFRSKYDKYNSEQLDELLRLQAQGRLGLSDQTKRLHLAQYTEPGLASLTNQQAALTTQGSQTPLTGQEYAKSLANTTALADLQGKIVSSAEQQINAEDAARQAQQLQELEQRSQYESAKKSERQEKILDVPAKALEGAVSAYNFGKLTNLPANGGTTALTALDLGMSDEEFESFIASQSPETQAIINKMMMQGNTYGR